jgi:glycosyltransferase involved in cell wall biosynthesis
VESPARCLQTLAVKIAIYSNVFDAKAGGGVLYILSIASALAQSHDVNLFFPGQVNFDEIKSYLPVSVSRLHMENSRSLSSGSSVLEIRNALKNTKYDQVIVQSTHVPRLSRFRNSALVCEFPFQKEPPIVDRGRLATFRPIIANSEFTAKWIRRRWGREAQVLYPAIFPVTPLPKEPLILSVGRLMGGKRSKHQLEMIRMFRELMNAGLDGWELHIAGITEDEQYARCVSEAAEGLPVVLHFNISRRDLEQLYGRASLFWHATGASCDPDIEPDRMEHFGIATVEAMSAGSVPIVINRGGQPEIVGGLENGVLWNSFEECKSATSGLINDQIKREQMSRQAVERAKAFRFPNFARRLAEILEGT